MGIDDQRKTICHLCLHGPYNEGWNYQENILPKYHVKLGYKVFQIVTPYIWEGSKIAISNDKHYLSPDGVVIFRCGISKGPTFGGRLTHYPEVHSLLDSISPDILFIHDVQCLDIVTVVKYLKEHKNCVTYVDNHSDFSNSATNWVSRNLLHKILWRHMAQKINPYVETFYGVLPARVDFLVDMYGLPKEKCKLLVMGADDEMVVSADKPDIKLEIRRKHKISENDFLIVTGGKIDLAKTQTIMLMQAVYDIQSPTIKLIVFGSVADALKDQVNSLVDGDKVQYIGWIDSKDSYKFFSAANLVVFPGRHSVFWEQVVAQGIPMIVKYWEGTTHVDIGGNVKFLRMDSKDEIKELIETIVQPLHYSEMLNSSQKARKQFLYSYIAKKCINYAEI